MSQPPPLASQPQPAEPASAPTSLAPVWSQLSAERQRQARLILAQMLLQRQAQETGHDPHAR